jgi:hypothetical protein
MVRQIGVVADEGIVGHEVMGLNHLTVRGEDKANLVAFGLGRFAGLERCQGFRHLAGFAGLDVDGARLQHAADVGFVRCAFAQLLGPGRGVVEAFEEGEGELCLVIGFLGQITDGLFDLDRVHAGVLQQCVWFFRDERTCWKGSAIIS